MEVIAARERFGFVGADWGFKMLSNRRYGGILFWIERIPSMPPVIDDSKALKS